MGNLTFLNFEASLLLFIFFALDIGHIAICQDVTQTNQKMSQILNFQYEDQPNKMPYCGDTGQHSRYVIHDRHLYRTVPKTFTTNKVSNQVTLDF